MTQSGNFWIHLRIFRYRLTPEIFEYALIYCNTSLVFSAYELVAYRSNCRTHSFFLLVNNTPTVNCMSILSHFHNFTTYFSTIILSSIYGWASHETHVEIITFGMMISTLAGFNPVVSYPCTGRYFVWKLLWASI
jgi:hypothetical protein